jgi:pimeloyl-ACP methyl ester carboxylesterase
VYDLLFVSKAVLFLGKIKVLPSDIRKVENFATADYHGNEFELIPQIILRASMLQSVFLLHPSLQLQSPFSNFIIYIFWTYQIPLHWDSFHCISMSTVLQRSFSLISGRQKFILVAHDWGGIIAWNFVFKHRDMLQSYIIMNSPYPPTFFQVVLSNKKQFFMSWYVVPCVFMFKWCIRIFI